LLVAQMRNAELLYAEVEGFSVEPLDSVNLLDIRY
jgi:hypothetical protein